ncbi:MAG: nitroreductase family protein [Bacteroidales bacterium]|nr:nitroreductase family protein [Bacteroidales bacterium]
MKKYIFSTLVTVIGMSCTANAEVLPQPKTTGGMPLMEAMSKRCSQRDINAASTVTRQELSDMLWAAWGITHDGKRTVATALNKQELEIYVVTATEISRYSAEDNTLTTIATGDFRNEVAMQGFAQTAPVNIVLVGDKTKQKGIEHQCYAAGAASQNIYLYCAQAGLKTVVRYGCDRDAMKKTMGLDDSKNILYVQTVGR